MKEDNAAQLDSLNIKFYGFSGQNVEKRSQTITTEIIAIAPGAVPQGPWCWSEPINQHS
jgi:hypothetical protein